MGNDAVAMSQEECCKTVRSSVKVRKVITNIRWRDELRHQPGPMDNQANRARRPSNLKRGRQGHRHAMSIAGSYRSSSRDYKPCSRQSPGNATRGTPREPSHSSRHVYPKQKTPRDNFKAGTRTIQINKINIKLKNKNAIKHKKGAP